MAQIQYVSQANLFGTTAAAFCLMFGLVFALLGIKIWWFKHRLNFQQHSQHKGATSNNSAAFGIVQRNNSSSSNSRDRQRLQVDGAVEVHGVFRKRQEDEWDYERVADQSPIRLSESTPDLKFTTQATKVDNKSPTPSNEMRYTNRAPIVPKRKRKERFSKSYETLQPPTREPPRPPSITTTSELRQMNDIVMPDFADFATQFNKVEIRNEIVSPQRSITPTVEIRRTPSPKCYKRRETESQDNNKFIQERCTAGFLSPYHDTLHATSSGEADILRKAADTESDRNLNEQSDRNSYIEYEKVDEFDSLVADKIKWETFDSVSDEVEIVTRNMGNLNMTPDTSMAAAVTTSTHFEPIRSPFMESSSVPSILLTPPPTNESTHNLRLFADLEETNAAHTVDQLWLQIEQQSDVAHLAHDFREFRHSSEMNEAHILDVPQRRSEMQIVEEEVVTTPTGYGKSIEEDWENFENLSLVTTEAEDIFEPRMESVRQHEMFSNENPNSRTHIEALFHDLEIPTPIEVHVVEATSPTLSEDGDVTDLVDITTQEEEQTLPDYDALMAHDAKEYMLPDYEAAVAAKANTMKTNDIKYVSSIEDLYKDLQQQENNEAPEATESAYITNIDELFEELGLEHKSSVRYPTESYLDAKCDNFASPSTSSSAAAPQPARRRRNQTRLKVRFDIGSSQYYLPEDLSPDSEASSEYGDDDSLCLSRDEPKARQRLTKLTNDSTDTNPFPYATMPAMLFGAQVANLDGDDTIVGAQASKSWLAISKLRAMQTTELQEANHPPVGEQPTREAPKPAQRKTSLMQDLQVDARPVAAARNIGNNVMPAQSNSSDTIDV